MTMEMEAEDDFFLRERIFHMLHDMNITRASLVVKEEVLFEFIDLSDEEHLEYQLFEPGNIPTNFLVNREYGRCPVCNAKLENKSTDENTTGHITEDYLCPRCSFEGTQWIAKTFIGHTSMIPEHTIESYKSLIEN